MGCSLELIVRTKDPVKGLKTCKEMEFLLEALAALVCCFVSHLEFSRPKKSSPKTPSNAESKSSDGSKAHRN